MARKDSSVEIKILKCCSEDVHLELYPDAQGNTCIQLHLSRVLKRTARILLSFLNLEIYSSLQVSRIPNCVFQYVRLSLFLRQGVLRDFNILLCLTHNSGSIPVFSSAVINSTSDTV